MSDSPHTKKVKPFPFEALLTHGTQAFPAHVMKMTMVGVMVETPSFLKVGEKYEIQFQTPVLKKSVQAHMVCVRTLDQYSASGGAGSGTHKLAELHFLDLAGPSRNNVIEFLRKIGLLK